LEKGQKREFIDTFCSNKFHKKMQSKVYLSVKNEKIHFCLHFCFKVWRSFFHKIHVYIIKESYFVMLYPTKYKNICNIFKINFFCYNSYLCDRLLLYWYKKTMGQSWSWLYGSWSYSYNVPMQSDLIWYFTYIMATSFSGGRSRSTRREPSPMGKQLVNFITCGCQSSATFFVIYKAGCEPTAYWYELLGNPTT
jgi:hypothetical protein